MTTSPATDAAPAARWVRNERAGARYGRENVRLAVLVRTGAVEEVVDNAADCHETILRLRAALEEH